MGFGVWGLGFGLRGWGSGCMVWGAGFRIWGFSLRVWGSGSRFRGSGLGRLANEMPPQGALSGNAPLDLVHNGSLGVRPSSLICDQHEINKSNSIIIGPRLIDPVKIELITQPWVRAWGLGGEVRPFSRYRTRTGPWQSHPRKRKAQEVKPKGSEIWGVKVDLFHGV